MHGAHARSVQPGDLRAPPVRPDHVVHFWEQEGALHEAVGAFLAEGLSSGCSALVIARTDHWAGSARRLAGRGIDVAALEREGRLVVLDAETQLSTFMDGDMPDESRFRKGFHDVLDRLERHGPVRAFGEMVDILWQRGNSAAAIKLEDYWNGLASERAFSLLCAYALGGFPHPLEIGDVETIVSRHAMPATRVAEFAGVAPGTAIPPEIRRLQQRAHSLEIELLRRAQLEATLHDALAARERADAVASETRRELADQLAGMNLLHELTTQLAGTREQQPLLEGLLTAAVTLSGTDAGLLWLANQSGEIEVGASRGLSPLMLQRMGAFDPALTPCGRALLERRRVVVERLGDDPDFEVVGSIAEAAGLVAVHSTPLVTRAGRALGVLSVFFTAPHRPSEREEHLIDLCARQAVDLIENQRLYARLQENDRRKDQFLATLAHELRNPLAPIRNAVQILRAPGTLPGGRHFAIDVIDRQVGQMARLVEDLIDVSRVTTGRLELRLARVDLREVLQHAMETSRPLIENAGQELIVTLPPRALFVDGDATRLAQVVSNLLNNAARYSNRGGRIRLSADARGDDAVIVVSDTGIGIDVDMLDRVFDMFARSEEATRRTQGSLGIGLTLARQLVTLHHGVITAESDGPGTGSTFTVRLPLSASTPRAALSPSHETAAPVTPSGLRVLVVDDNVDSAETMAIFLGAIGHDVRTSHDGIEAVMVASDFHPEVLLLDIGLPGQSGYDVARAVRCEPWAANICIVAVSGWSQESDRIRSREAGFDHHLVKPVDHRILQDILAAARAGASRA